jgi:hypothetical protein
VNGMEVGLATVITLAFVLKTPKATAAIRDVGESNVVLRFYGWVDQTKTDFLTGRSLAIQATKSALETAGFALPEPICRLRFDETAPGAGAEPAIRFCVYPARQEAESNRHPGCQSGYRAGHACREPGERGARNEPAE